MGSGPVYRITFSLWLGPAQIEIIRTNQQVGIPLAMSFKTEVSTIYDVNGLLKPQI